MSVFTSLGDVCVANTFIATNIGTASQPLENVHRASTDNYQNDLSFKESASGETRMKIKTDGHLQICEDLELFSGTDLETGTKKFTVGLDTELSESFVVRNESVYYYVHTDVPGVSRVWNPKSRISRHSLNMHALEQLTKTAHLTLPGCRESRRRTGRQDRHNRAG